MIASVLESTEAFSFCKNVLINVIKIWLEWLSMLYRNFAWLEKAPTHFTDIKSPRSGVFVLFYNFSLHNAHVEAFKTNNSFFVPLHIFIIYFELFFTHSSCIVSAAEPIFSEKSKCQSYRFIIYCGHHWSLIMLCDLPWDSPNSGQLC